MKNCCLKILLICFALTISACVFSACGNSAKADGAFNVSDSVTPEYDSDISNFQIVYYDNGECAVKKYLGVSAYVEIPEKVTYNATEYSVTEILDNAFYFEKNSNNEGYNAQRKQLKDVKLPSGLFYIGEFAFGWCEELENVVVPKQVAQIGYGAFNGCSSLRKLTIPFVGGTKGSRDSQVTNFGYIFGARGWSENSNYLPNTLYSVTVTNCVRIEENAFAECRKLTSINLPDTLNYIGEKAFWWCEGLLKIEIPDSTNIMGKSVFNGCSHLIELKIPFLGPIAGGNVYSNIGYFFGTEDGSENVKFLPDTLRKINLTKQIRLEDGAFEGLYYLKDIILSDTLTQIEGDAFKGCTSLQTNELNGVHYLGSESKKYLTALYADKDIVSAEINENCLSIQAGTFELCNKLTSVKIPEGVRFIGSNAFYRCENLESVEIPSSVVQIGDYAFFNDQKLTSVAVNDDCVMQKIGRFAFYNCVALESFNISPSVESVGYSAFMNCSNLKTVKIVDLSKYFLINLYGVASSPFAYCENLYVDGVQVSEITIPSNIVQIKKFAFANLKCVSSVNLNNVTDIDAFSFYGVANGLTVKTAKADSELDFEDDWAFNGNVTVEKVV